MEHSQTEEVARLLDELKFPTFASSLRRGDNVASVLLDFENPPPRPNYQAMPSWQFGRRALRLLLRATYAEREVSVGSPLVRG